MPCKDTGVEEGLDSLILTRSVGRTIAGMGMC